MSPENEIPLDEESGIEERPQNRREWSGAFRSLALPLLIVATIIAALVPAIRAARTNPVQALRYE